MCSEFMVGSEWKTLSKNDMGQLLDRSDGHARNLDFILLFVIVGWAFPSFVYIYLYNKV